MEVVVVETAVAVQTAILTAKQLLAEILDFSFATVAVFSVFKPSRVVVFVLQVSVCSILLSDSVKRGAGLTVVEALRLVRLLMMRFRTVCVTEVAPCIVRSSSGWT
jgi:hypothetical protein